MAKQPRPKNKIGRRRRAAGWTLLAMAFAIGLVWGASGVWSAEVGTDRGSVGFVFGQVRIMRSDQPWRTGGLYVTGPARLRAVRWRLDAWVSQPFDLRGWNWFVVSYASPPIFQPPRHWVTVPLWLPMLLVGVPATLLLRSGILARRRAMTNACPTCGYSLAGITDDAPCPECGRTREADMAKKAK